MRADDLASLMLPQQAGALGWRQGVVLAYDQATGANTIRVGGTTVENLPILNTSEALLLTPGARVGLLVAGRTWAILGRITVPGTADALSALQALRTQAAEVTASEDRSSTTPGDLATPGPAVTVTIGPSGRALVTVGCEIKSEVPAGWSINSAGGFMGFAGSGANVLTANNVRAAFSEIRYDSSSDGEDELGDLAIRLSTGASRTSVLTGLTPGSTTLTAKYWVTTGTSTFANRTITVVAL